MKIFRWKAIVPMLVTLIVVAVLWTLYIDVVVRRAIEYVGAEVVGAKVDVGSARLSLRHADLLITGVAVTDPDAPMTNLFELPELRATLNGRALLMKKVVVESLSVRGVRFGTARKTSGALKNLPPKAGIVTRNVLAWAGSIRIPTLDLRGIVGTVVNVPAINPDSLRTLRQARAALAQGDSLRGAFETQLAGLDPRPTVDSAHALAERIKATDLRRLNAVQLASTANDVRTMIGRVNALKLRVDSAKARTTSGISALHASVAGLDAARQADLAFVRGLVHLPSFEGPDVSMALFGTMVTERLKPIMHWVNVAEQYVPPGLDPRRHTGPSRLRKAGTTFDFPLAHSWPDFLVERADADLAIGGRTAVAGEYAATIAGVTTEPTVYGRPTTFTASRRSTVGPHDLQVSGMMDRAGAPRDSLFARVPGVQIPAFVVPQTGASLDLGDSGLVELSLSRSGGEMRGTWTLTSDAVRWIRTSAAAPGPAPRLGTQEWAEGLVWQSLASIRNVVMTARISGAVTHPSIALSSNVGDALALSIKRVMGAELQRAESQVQAKVDSLVARQVNDVRAKAVALETQVTQRVGLPAEQLAQAQAELNDLLSRVTSTVPGLHLPSLPSLPRRP